MNEFVVRSRAYPDTLLPAIAVVSIATGCWPLLILKIPSPEPSMTTLADWRSPLSNRNIDLTKKL